MRVLIIGGGLIGITTAFWLGRSGHDVVVIERQEAAGLETSYANAGMITPGMCQPWNAPASWRVLLRSLARSDASLQLHWWTLPGVARWGTRFLLNSTTAAYQRNHRHNLRLALYSLGLMRSLREQTRIEYSRAARGSLALFRDERSLEKAWKAAAALAPIGLHSRRLSQVETIALEPALSPIAGHLSGSLHYEMDEVGDAHLFCAALAQHAQSRGIEFHYNTQVTSVETDASGVVAVNSTGKRFVADQYVVAAGSYSAPLLRPLGVRLPIYPAKGYSLTFRCAPDQRPLRHPLIAHHLHAVIVPFEHGTIRVAGTAEFAGFDRTLNPVRLQKLSTLMQDLLPGGQWQLAAGKAWCGLRPSSPDGVAVIGATPLRNLWVNTGQGHLGWTLAAGSGRLLGDLISGVPPAIDPTPYCLTRFSRL